MGSQRPPRAAVRAALRAELADLEPGNRVVVGLSGGADSLALTAGAAAVSRELGLLCEAIVVDHQLQVGSAAIAARAAEQAGILGCADVRVVTVEVAHGPGAGGIEAAARAGRYGALDAAAAGSDGPPSVPVAAAVLLGHTREDQAETVLLGLARGSGTRSLSGMRARAGRYRRPLLGLPRGVVAAAAWAAAESDARLEPWTDPHNGDPAYARVRVRSQVLPLLESTLGPGIVEALARTAALAQEDADALDAWADRVWAQVQMGGAGDDSGTSRPHPRSPDIAAPELGGVVAAEGRQPSGLPDRPPTSGLPLSLMPVDALHPRAGDLPPAVIHRVIRRFLVDAGCPPGDLSFGHIRAVAGLLELHGARAEIALPGGVRARRVDDALVVRA